MSASYNFRVKCLHTLVILTVLTSPRLTFQLFCLYYLHRCCCVSLLLPLVGRADPQEGLEAELLDGGRGLVAAGVAGRGRGGQGAASVGEGLEPCMVVFCLRSFFFLWRQDAKGLIRGSMSSTGVVRYRSWFYDL